MRTDTVRARLPGTPLHPAGPGAGCSTALTRDDVGAMVRNAVREWSTAPGNALTLARVVTREVRWIGSASLDADLLADLAAVRADHRGRDPRLDAFLDSVLARYDGRYWNRTYLCLPLLEQLVEGPRAPLTHAGLVALLAADIVRSELCASRRGMPVSPLGRPDGRTLRTRLRHAIRLLTADLGPDAATALLGAVAADPLATLPDVLARLPAAPAPWATEWLDVSALPVSTVHDETFFIRALQAHEMLYGTAARLIGDATACALAGHPGLAADLVDRATETVDRGQSLFRMVATMRYEAFHSFREHTDGASAIQSEQYKRFEVRCGTPPPDRLDCPAFEQVPSVSAELGTGRESLTDAWQVLQRRRPGDPGTARLTAGMAALEASHRRWKGTHVTVATRMLGEARGSGHTSGVSYLRSWLDHRLFWALPEVAAADR
ncbi:hypothetical protein [Trujillonella endophytica]|uniref:Tryptophan 2,3-dioxygenase (Vermilion) n=1 Tax=Trujillonella endophytica TaxID=673521 RepID=A0A1H8V051_9ACTN|nr:hypothetical protein [Trujillella endophytica]SEP08604.1 Tryptophan 2,3-dioxygenase (vermilion) [Trujillella endophytica]